MALISKERTLTWEKIKSITSLDIAKIWLLCSLILPFFIFKRAAPQFAFFAELTSVICISLFLIFIYLSPKLSFRLHQTSYYFIIIAIYLILDLYINPSIYLSIQWLYIGSLLLGALLANAISALNEEYCHQKVFVTVCYFLMIGALLQDIIVILQMLHQQWLGSFIYYIDSGNAYSGNIGQRNLLAHYLSWGILATSYLVYKRNLSQLTGWTLIIFQAAILGAINSRSLIVYMLAILMILVITMFWQKHLAKSLFKTIATTVVLVLIFQILTTPILSFFQSTTVDSSSVSRMTSNSGMLSRLSEWYKAWLIFSDNPWFGTGWSSYGYQGFVMSSDPTFANSPYENRLFSHSHNIIFNLLAETGIIGTTIILGSFGYLLKPLFMKKWQVETVIIVSMLTVTAIHSVIELPLWFTNFFIVFVILLTLLLTSLTPYKPPSTVHHTFVRLISTISALVFLFLAAQMYYYYWKMEQYSFVSDKSEQDKLNTAKNIFAIGEQQPLIKAYSDYQAFNYLIGISPDNLPSSFHKPLSDYAYYLPQRLPGIYYLATQCDNNGAWSHDNWQYYNQLKHYYTNTLPTYSIILSMTTKCNQVYGTVYHSCESYYKEQGQKPICSVADSRARLGLE